MVFLTIYYIITVILSVAFLIICKKYIKTEKTRDLVFKTVSIVTVALHYSVLWVDYLTTGSASVPSNLLFAIHPCHITMWITLIASLIKNKEGKVFQFLVNFIFYLGIICASIGIIFNENYLASSSIADYSDLKGLVSHSTLLFTCLYVLVMGYLKVDFKNNFIGIILGLTLLLVQGFIINTLFSICNLEPPNAMYLQKPPFENMPFINTLTIGVLGVIVGFVWTLIMEYFFVPKEQRFFVKLKKVKEV